MNKAINQAFGIENRDRKKLYRLGPIFLVGLAYVAGEMACQTLFVSRFAVQYLPLMYLVEAGILPLQLLLFSMITRRFSQGKLIRILYALIASVLAACAGFLVLMLLHTEQILLSDLVYSGQCPGQDFGSHYLDVGEWCKKNNTSLS